MWSVPPFQDQPRVIDIVSIRTTSQRLHILTSSYPYQRTKNMASRTLYVLYNADASIMGKLRYGYRKICHSSEDNPACAACMLLQCFLVSLLRNSESLICAGDITHGGLSLNETPAWIEAKEEIEAESGFKVVQWHRDELSEKVRRGRKLQSTR